MQTFLPYESFKKSAECLDYKRCFKQVVEAKQILSTLKFKQERAQAGQSTEKISRGWLNHPAVLMWEGFETALMIYYNTFYNVCEEKWGVNFQKCQKIVFEDDKFICNLPKWLGNPLLHASHRGRLLDKKPEHYKQFEWEEEPIPEKIGYWWPIKTKKCDNSKIMEWFSSKYILINYSYYFPEKDFGIKMVKKDV
jgi:hypothetical protein